MQSAVSQRNSTHVITQEEIEIGKRCFVTRQSKITGGQHHRRTKKEKQMLFVIDSEPA